MRLTLMLRRHVPLITASVVALLLIAAVFTVDDWPLLLQFVEALAPIVAVLGIVLAARLAVDSYREQRTIDRRLEWYERMFRRLYRLAIALRTVKVLSTEAGSPQGAITESVKQIQRYMLQYRDASLYASPKAFAALERLTLDLTKIVHSMDVKELSDLEVLENIAGLCESAADEVARDFRIDMKMPVLNTDRDVPAKRKEKHQ